MKILILSSLNKATRSHKHERSELSNATSRAERANKRAAWYSIPTGLHA